jgi:hypothetical protein
MKSLLETIFFWSRNDYLMICNLMRGDMDKVWQGAEISNADSKAVLREYETGIRTPNQKAVKTYKKRVWEKLDEKTKVKIIKTAEKDIKNIMAAMTTAPNDMVLYRNVRAADAPKVLGGEIELNALASASIAPNPQEGFILYEIQVPKGTKTLNLDQFDCEIRNEDGEVILPPGKFKIS